MTLMMAQMAAEKKTRATTMKKDWITKWMTE
jgi:hypothetical protein